MEALQWGKTYEKEDDMNGYKYDDGAESLRHELSARGVREVRGVAGAFSSLLGLGPVFTSGGGVYEWKVKFAGSSPIADFAPHTLSAWSKFETDVSYEAWSHLAYVWNPWAVVLRRAHEDIDEVYALSLKVRKHWWDDTPFDEVEDQYEEMYETLVHRAVHELEKAVETYLRIAEDQPWDMEPEELTHVKY